MTAESHDRLLAETLFLTHYVAQAVARGGFVRTDIDTLSFGFLMDAVESVKNDVDLFRDVFFFNPYCEDIIVRFERAEWELHALLDGRRKLT
jgi:prephenate dehydrogenase